MSISVNDAGTDITVRELICCEKRTLEELMGKQFNKEPLILLED